MGFNPNDTVLIMVRGCSELDNLSHVASRGGYVGTVLVLLKGERVGLNATIGEGGNTTMGLQGCYTVTIRR